MIEALIFLSLPLLATAMILLEDKRIRSEREVQS